ncbi:MAG TPA: 3-hydroxy-5-phosphonooxypentane-2,4-dione thiolase [Candidatus Polarisedimenticolaceae bacterium]|nr:3-hydroxy-5-phosphonooxypentane-2,4-dione thiolase [Candidatus Polarisedimenticolaceae bacterium]
MDWGMQNRLSRILDPRSGRTVMLAIDHGYFLGPTSGLEAPGRTCAPLLPYADSLMLTRGTLRQCIPANSNVPIVLRVSGGTSILRELSNEGLTVAIEDAIRLNASAVTLSVFVGSEGERTTLLNLAKLVDYGQQYGVPVLAVTAVGKEMTRDARYLGLACRISAELGAHFVKTYYCDGFDEVVAATPVPIVIAGGKKIAEREAIELAAKAVRAGASGVDMGRNIFQSDCPVGMIRAVRSVVHDGASATHAFEIYREQKEAAGAGSGLLQQ